MLVDIDFMTRPRIAYNYCSHYYNILLIVSFFFEQIIVNLMGVSNKGE